MTDELAKEAAAPSAPPAQEKAAPADLSGAVHSALDKSEKALAIAKRLEKRQAERDDTPSPAAAQVVAPTPEPSAWGKFVSGLTGVPDELDEREVDANG